MDHEIFPTSVTTGLIDDVDAAAIASLAAEAISGAVPGVAVAGNMHRSTRATMHNPIKLFLIFTILLLLNQNMSLQADSRTATCHDIYNCQWCGTGL
jgi:hypothetical protein